MATETTRVRSQVRFEAAFFLGLKVETTNADQTGMGRFGERVKRNSRKNWIAIVGALLAMCLFVLGYDSAGYIVFLAFGLIHLVRHFRRGDPWWA